jgi:sulfur carrier protein
MPLVPAPGNATGTPMQILVNGEPRRFDAPPTLADVLEGEGLAGRRVAVEVNRCIVPRGRHAQHRLADGDAVEIVHALGGG